MRPVLEFSSSLSLSLCWCLQRTEGVKVPVPGGCQLTPQGRGRPHPPTPHRPKAVPPGSIRGRVTWVVSGLVGAPLPPPHQQSLVVSEPQPKPLHLRGVIFGFSKSLQFKRKTVEGGQRTSRCLMFQVKMLEEKRPPHAASLSEARDFSPGEGVWEPVSACRMGCPTGDHGFLTLPELPCPPAGWWSPVFLTRAVSGPHPPGVHRP